jgi:hypothetical protein
VVPIDGLGTCGEDRVPVLHDNVGRESALRHAEVHRAAARVEADAELACDLDLDGQQILDAAREHVVVVGCRRTAALEQRGEAGPRGGPFDRRVQPGPRGIQLHEPLEQRRLERQAPGRPLVQVVVAVDQAGGDQAARRVDALTEHRGGPAAHVLDPAGRFVEHDVAVPVDRAGDGRDRAAFDDLHALAASRTASRIFS